MPIYGKKKQLKIFSRTKKVFGMNIGTMYIALGTKFYQVYSNDDPNLAFKILLQSQICFLIDLCG